RRASLDGDAPARVAAERVDRVEARDAVDPAGHREEDVVVQRRRGLEAQPIAQAPHHRAGEDVDRGERAVAARDVEELARALEAERAARRRGPRGPRVAPARLAAPEGHADEAPLAFR